MIYLFIRIIFYFLLEFFGIFSYVMEHSTAIPPFLFSKCICKCSSQLSRSG
nr:MAG TPA: hypothetical protein [Caudoviricetes sp.]